MTKVTTISSKTNPLIQHFILLQSDKKYRNEKQRVLVEGINAISDLLKTTTAERLIVLSGYTLPKDLLYKEIIYVTFELLQKISKVKTTQSVIAELEIPKESSLDEKKLIIAFDQLQDPGNLGTLLRSALALGFEGAFFINGCDPFNDKALRAAKGATFNLPFQHGTWDTLQQIVEKNKLTPFIASINGKSVLELKIPERILLILGNESQGVQNPSHFQYQKVSIPMHRGVESLNVASAGAILMYALQNQGLR